MSRNIKTIARARSIHEESIELHGVVTNAFVWSGSAKNLLRELPELPGDGKLFDVSGKDPYKNVERKRAATLMKFRGAAKALIAATRIYNTFAMKDKITWGPATNAHDVMSGEIFKARETSGYLEVGSDGRMDSREEFYRHDVVAARSLGVVCFDALCQYLSGTRREREKRERREGKERVREVMARNGEFSRVFDKRKSDEKPKGSDEDSLSDHSSDDDVATPEPSLRSSVISTLHIPSAYATCSSPVFVTWSKEGESSTDVFLRGNSGSMAPKELRTALPAHAIKAAASENNLQYFPISANEVRRLSVAIEIPNHYESLYNVGDWVPGVHGVCIRFEDSIGGKYSGMMMPVDMIGVEADSVVASLMSIAGYGGTVTAVMIKKSIMMRFQTTTVTMGFEEYRQIAKERVGLKEERRAKEEKRRRAALAKIEEERVRRLEKEERKKKRSADREARSKKKNERKEGDEVADESSKTIKFAGFGPALSALKPPHKQAQTVAVTQTAAVT